MAGEEKQPPRPDGSKPPLEALMYGPINDSIEQLICERYGRGKWHDVKERAGLMDFEDGDFQAGQQYDQEVTNRLLSAITEVLGLTTEEALEATGEHFVTKYLMLGGYIDLLRSQGKNLREFLQNVDSIHAHLKRQTMPEMSPPSFKTADADDEHAFLLHYWSFRPGFGPFVQGIVRACGLVLFEQETSVEELRASEDSGVHYALFRVATCDAEDTAVDSRQLRRGGVAHASGSDLTDPASTGGIWPDAQGVEISSRRVSTNLENAGFPGQSQQQQQQQGVSPKGFRQPWWKEEGNGGGSRRPSSEAGHMSPHFWGASFHWLRRDASEQPPSDGLPSGSFNEATLSGSSKNNKKPKLIHSSEVAALVFMMQETIQSMSCSEDVDRFAQRFSVDQLCSLLSVRGTPSVQALTCLFREPIKAAGGLRPPHHAFLNRHLRVLEQPTASMHRGITSRYTDAGGAKRVDPFNAPLADQHRIRGLLGCGGAHSLTQVKLRVCVLPRILCYKVLHKIATSKTRAIFETTECEALLTAAWDKVKFRYVLDCLLEVCLNGVLCEWTERLRRGESAGVGFAFLVMMICKELSEELWSGYVHHANGQLRKFISWPRVGEGVRLLLATVFCVMSRRGDAPNNQRPVLAGVVVFQWLQMLFMCRAFEMLGPKLLPIIYTAKAMGPFLIVLIFYVGAFLHAYWTLSSKPVAEVLTIGYRLGIMGDFALDAEDESGILENDEMDSWLVAWFFVCSALLTLFMMNVVIGVLGESYDVEHDQARVSFLQSRAAICAEYCSRVWKVQRPIPLYRLLGQALHHTQDSLALCCTELLLLSPVALLYGLLRCFVAEWHCYDYQGHHAGQDTTAPYLWMCYSPEECTEARVSEGGRMQLMTQRIDERMRKVEKLMPDASRMQHTLDRILDEVKEVTLRLDALEGSGAAPRRKGDARHRSRGSGNAASAHTEAPRHRQQPPDAPRRHPSPPHLHPLHHDAPTPSPRTCPFSGAPLPPSVLRHRPSSLHAPSLSHIVPMHRSKTVSSASTSRSSFDAPWRQPPRPDRAEKPGELTMYGLIMSAVEPMVSSRYGLDAWHAVKAKARVEDIDDGDFVQSEPYDQEVFDRMVDALAAVQGMEREVALRTLGQYYVGTHLVQCGYLELLRAQGKDLREFLGNMDTMHAYLKSETLPGLAPPSFMTEDAEDGAGFLLHYWSFRAGLAGFVQGMVTASGRVLFEQETKVEVLRTSDDADVYYVLFKVLCDGR